MRIITGSTGTTHVTSNDDGEFNQGIFGTDLIVFTNGEQLDAAVVDNNTIRVKDGDLIMQGRHALIAPNTTEDVIIETGAVGVNRNDLIVARYVMDTGTGYEDITLEVVKGTETAGEASDPEYVTGDIRTGSTLVEVPLYRVRITGISIAGIDKLFTPSMSMREMIATLNETLTKHENSITELNNALDNPFNTLTSVTLPFTAETNGLLKIRMAPIDSDSHSYHYLKSELLGNFITAQVSVNGLSNITWCPVIKGDTISVQNSNASSCEYHFMPFMAK